MARTTLTLFNVYFFFLGLTSVLNISGTLNIVLPYMYMNAMPQTQNMPLRPVTDTDTERLVVVLSFAVECLHWNKQLPILMSWVRPDREILPRLSTNTSERSSL